MHAGDPRQLPIDVGDSSFERADFLDEVCQGLLEHIGERAGRVVEDRGHARQHPARAGRDRISVFPQHASDHIDAPGARGLPLGPHAMQRLQRLWSTVLTGTGCTPAQRAASSIASVSVRSVL